MTFHVPADDEQLLAELNAALRRAGPLPAHARHVAQGVYTWRTIDEELALAEVVFDSTIADQQLVRRDTVPGIRTLVFEAESLAIDIEIAADVLIGQIRPAQLGHIRILRIDRDPLEVTTGADGTFSIIEPITTSIRLDCRTIDDAVSTGWFNPYL